MTRLNALTPLALAAALLASAAPLALAQTPAPSAPPAATGQAAPSPGNADQAMPGKSMSGQNMSNQDTGTTGAAQTHPMKRKRVARNRVIHPGTSSGSNYDRLNGKTNSDTDRLNQQELNQVQHNG